MTRSEPHASDHDPQERSWLQAAAPSGAGGASFADEHEGELAAPIAESTPTLSPAPTPPAAPPPEPVAVPITWLVDHGAAPIRYRTIVDLAKLSPLPDRLLSLVYGFEPAVKLALAQRPEGTWHNAMLAIPASRADFDGVGTIPAFRRLLEYGWDREAPPLFHARRLLFRLLAEDSDPSLLFELSEKAKSEDDGVRRNRALLREGAAAALAQAGYESDPRLRGAALRLLQRVMTFLRSPLAADPWITAGGKRTLAPTATPPSYFLLLMLAHMPLFRLEHASELDELLKYLTSAPPGDARAGGGQGLLVTGDPLADGEIVNNDIGFVVAWLELAARLGYLKKHQGWAQVFERLLGQCDEDFVWRTKRSAAARSSNAFVWPTFPLTAPDDPSADVTFRLGLIARHAGRPLELV